MLNRTFSIEKDRELSPLEARIGSFRRRLVNPLGRRSNTLGGSALPTTFPEYLAMGRTKKKVRQMETKKIWEASETEESHSSIDRVGAGEVSEQEDGSGNDNKIVPTSGGRPQNRGGGSSSQRALNPTLAPWAQAVNEATQSLGVANRAIKDLQGKFKLHMGDLRMMDETMSRLNQLERSGKEKDETITRLNNTITTLRDIDGKTKDIIEQKMAEIAKKKEELDQDKAKQEKRSAMVIEEEKLKSKAELDKLTAQQIQSFEKRRADLEDEFSQRRKANDKTIATLENEKKQLQKTVEEQKTEIKVKSEKLEKYIDQCDMLQRAKDSYKSDKLAREKELEMMKEEFALNSKPKDYFKQEFAEIYGRIKEISLKYFNDPDGEDLERVHKELIKADSHFASVLIDDSDDSRNLRAAHAQRIISNAICEYIWKPFRSDFTLPFPEFDDLLSKISDGLGKLSNGGRTANVWTALTMRGLQSLPVHSVPLGSRPNEDPHSTRPRAESVVSRVFSVLSPLVSSSQKGNLRIELLALAGSAIEVWSYAQTGELKIIVSTSLERAHREEWRSKDFDPELPSGSDETKLDMSKTHPRILTLFPRVVAREMATPLLGSWPGESDKVPRIIDTSIHPGSGLPEWSPLIVRVKEAQEELQKWIMSVKKQWRSQGHGRRESRGSFTSGPPSPTEQLKM